MPADQRLLRKNILLFSLYFLVMFAAMGVIQPFLTLHFKAIGFSGVQIGSLIVVSSLVLIFSAPQYGLLFDTSRHKKRTLLISAVILTIALFFIPFLRAYGLVLFFYTIFRVVNSSSVSAIENLSYQVSASASRQQKPAFGSLRLWGSIGFGVTAMIGGKIYEQSGIMLDNWLFLGLMAASILILLIMPESLFRNHQPEQPETNRLGMGGILKLIFSNRFLMLTVIALAITDTLNDGIRSFEPIYMQELQLTEGTIGLAATLSALFEVPFMFWSDRLIEKFGIRKIVLFIFVFDLVRRLAVWFFPVGWVVFSMSVATCVSFTLRLVSTIYLVNLCIPQHYTTTAITFISVTLNGASHILSNAISGVVYDVYGGRELYLMSAILCLVSLGFALAAGQPKTKIDIEEPV